MVIHKRYCKEERLVYECTLLGSGATILPRYNKALFVGPAITTWVGKSERNLIVNQMKLVLQQQQQQATHSVPMVPQQAAWNPMSAMETMGYGMTIPIPGSVTHYDPRNDDTDKVPWKQEESL